MVRITSYNVCYTKLLREQTVPEFETKWAPLIMPIMSASESFTQHVEGKRPERAVLSFGIKNFNLFIAPISDYTLVVLVAAGRGTQRIPLVVDRNNFV